MEMQRAQRAIAASGIAVWLRIREHHAPAYDRQRQEPRHRLLLDARHRMAQAQGRLRVLAGAGKFRRAGTAADELERVESVSCPGRVKRSGTRPGTQEPSRAIFRRMALDPGSSLAP